MAMVSAKSPHPALVSPSLKGLQCWLIILLIGRCSLCVGVPSGIMAADSTKTSNVEGTSLDLGSTNAAFNGDLEEWLAAVKFDVPDDALAPLTIPFDMLGFKESLELKIKGLECDGLRVGTLRPGSGGNGPHERADGGIHSRLVGAAAVEIQVGRVAISCKGTVDYSTSLGLSGSAETNVHTKDADLAVAVSLISTNTSMLLLPQEVQLTNCSSKLRLQLEIVSGSAWTWIVQHIPGAASQLQDVVNTELASLFCGSALEKGRLELNTLLGEVYNFAMAATNTPPQPPPPWDTTMVPLQDVPLLRWLQQFGVHVNGSAGLLSDQLQKLLPGGQMPIVGNEAWALSSPVCLVGADADNKACAIARSLHHQPPAELRVTLESLGFAANMSDLEVLDPHNVTLDCQLNASEAHVRGLLDLVFNGWAGGAEAANLTAELGVDIALSGLGLSSTMAVSLDSSSFGAIPSHRYIFPQCLAPALNKFEAVSLAADLRVESVKLTLLKNTPVPSPLVTEAVELGSNMLSALFSFEDGIVAVMNGLLQANVTSLVTNHVEAWANGLRSKQCPEAMGQETDDGKSAPLIDPDLAQHCNWVAAVLALAGCLCGLAKLVRFTCAGQRSGSSRGSRLWWYQDALGAAVTTPKAVSLAIPFFILACIFFLAGSNYLAQAGTFVNLESQGSTWLESRTSVRVDQVMVYSLFYSIKRLIDEGGSLRFLAYVIALFSGVLPYAKLFAMLISWLAPAKFMSMTWRGRVLLFMDQIGKFSLVDVFVIQFISATLYTTADVPGRGPQLNVALRTNQDVGFTCFVLATVGSLIIGHACVHFHERDPRVVRRSLQNADEVLASQALCCFSDDARCAACDVDAALHGRPRHRVVGSLMLIIGALATCGCALPAVDITLKSPFGAFSHRTYSLFGFASKLPDLAEEPNLFSTRFSQGTFVFFAIVTIHAHVALLLFAWLAKLSRKRLMQVNKLSHVLLAWSALDVCIISMVLTLIEMTISDFVPLSSQQQHFISQITNNPSVSDEGLKVEIVLLSGTYILGVTAVLHCFVSRIVMNDLERVLLAVELHQQRSACSGRLELSCSQSAHTAQGALDDAQGVGLSPGAAIPNGDTAGVHVDQYDDKKKGPAADESHTHV